MTFSLPCVLWFGYSYGYAAMLRTDCSAGSIGSTDPRPSPTQIAYPIFILMGVATRHL
jgi:hypothetical protein